MTVRADRYPFPELLAAIPRDRGAAIEASAGTGKTHLIEHLVVDRVIAGDARLEEILVVTFTDRAAAELRRRIRALVGNVLAGRAPAGMPAEPAWTIDDAARTRLEDATVALDLAPISTIHAFCNGILVEQAFAGGRLFAQTQVDSRTAFNLAFAETLRRRLAVDPELTPYLEAWLGQGRVERLEDLLYKARQLRCDWGTVFDPARLRAAAHAYAGVPADEIQALVFKWCSNKGTAKRINERFQLLDAVVGRYLAGGSEARYLAEIDLLVRGKEIFSWAAEPARLGAVSRTVPAVAALLARVAALADASPPLATAVAQRFGPLVEERLAARKRAAGQYDFDDMLAAVAAALRGPAGPGLIAALRERYRLAVIDEFQDTDPVQWEIFRTIFGDGERERPLYLIGDPKQSIYGFRGADVATYAEARDAIAGGDAPHRLSRNFRSRRAVVDAYNAILDPAAEAPFFGDVVYEPVAAATTADADPRPPIALLRVAAEPDAAQSQPFAPSEERKLPMRAVRAALARAIADEIARLLGAPGAPAAKKVFVLTRTRVESKAIADALTARGVSHVLYNQEGLFDTEEARHVRDLLRAIEDPHDPERRLRAWLTPFFGLRLGDLPAAAAGGDQPFVDRLLEWHALAAQQDFGRLAGRILDTSGVVRRELFLGESLRRLTNYQQLFEVVAAQAATAPLGEVVQRLAALCARIIVPKPEEGNELRAEGDRDAVQIMTLHKAKGLEAEAVFLYGGFWPGPVDTVRTYTTEGRRTRLAGRPRLPAVVDLIKHERDSEDQRLYYVGLTRARTRLYLPFSGSPLEAEPTFDGVEREEYWELRGGYRHVNHRLRALAADPRTRPLFESRDVAVSAKVADIDPTAAARAEAIAAWRPDAADLAEAPGDATLAALRRTRRGPTTTSYSRIKQAHGGYRPPTELLDETATAGADDAAAGRDELPGGARSGQFIHDLLEQVSLPSLRETPDADDWAARPEVVALTEGLLRKHGREPRHREAACRLAHAALTAPLPVVGGGLPGGLPGAAREVRELEFLLPFPDAAGGADRGFVKGFVDVIFEHEGRTYFGDWKTDHLPHWDEETVDAHVEANYVLQERIYALALVRMLGIEDAAAHEARFGGTLYVFVRGLAGGGGIRSRRPSWDELQRWRAELADTLGGAEGDPP